MLETLDIKNTTMLKFIKRNVLLLALLLSVGFTVTTTTSCAKKVGCAVNDNIGPKTNRDGTLKMNRGKSSLYGKKRRKRMRN